MARPHKLTDAVIEKLCQALKLGATYDLAARYAGISARVLRLWRIEAEAAAPGTIFQRLIARLEAAEGEAALRWLKQIDQAAQDGNWQAAAWKLERRYPEHYGRKVQVDAELSIRTAAARVAEDLGLDADELLHEAEALLMDVDRG